MPELQMVRVWGEKQDLCCNWRFWPGAGCACGAEAGCPEEGMETHQAQAVGGHGRMVWDGGGSRLKLVAL